MTTALSHVRRWILHRMWRLIGVFVAGLVLAVVTLRNGLVPRLYSYGLVTLLFGCLEVAFVAILCSWAPAARRKLRFTLGRGVRSRYRWTSLALVIGGLALYMRRLLDETVTYYFPSADMYRVIEVLILLLAAIGLWEGARALSTTADRVGRTTALAVMACSAGPLLIGALVLDLMPTAIEHNGGWTILGALTVALLCVIAAVRTRGGLRFERTWQPDGVTADETRRRSAVTLQPPPRAEYATPSRSRGTRPARCAPHPAAPRTRA